MTDGQAERWDELYRGQGRQWRGVTDISGLGLEPGSRVLEVGCGNGKTLAALKEAGFSAVGVDFSQEAVGACRRLFPDTDVVCGVLLSLPFGDGSFDCVILFHVLENIAAEDMDTAVSEIRRVLRPGGKAYVRTFASGDMRSEKGERISDDTVIRGNGIRYRYYSEDSLTSAFRTAYADHVRTVTESTRFGTVRSRVEAVFTFR
ncbi:MAG: class I SAM-dependent methyltransferase [Candidatus Methanomethylophilaceae archaeon]